MARKFLIHYLSCAGFHLNVDPLMDINHCICLILFPFRRFIRRSDGKWTYAVVKSMEETQAGRSAIRFTVNKKNSSKSYGKKYWGTHVRPLKGTKLKPPPHERGSSSEEREGRAKKRESDRQSSTDNNEEDDRGYSCPPPTQSRLTFDWAGGVRHGRSRSRSRRRAVSFSPMRALVSIKESAAEEEENEDGSEPESESASEGMKE